MAVDTAGVSRNSFDLKSAQLPVVAVMLKSTDMADFAAELAARLADDPEFFDNEPVLIDLSAVRDAEAPLDIAALVAVLQMHHAQPVAARGGNPAQMAAAHAAGLVAAPEVHPVRAAAPPAEPAAVQEAAEAIEPAQMPQMAHAVAPDAPVPVELLAEGLPTVIVDKPLRSGQQVYARGADLVVMAVVSFGAEVMADGNIHVYAPLRGRALAGARGNTEARIFSTCMEPQLVSIAGIYRTTDTELPDNVRGKPAQVRLDGEKLFVEPL